MVLKTMVRHPLIKGQKEKPNKVGKSNHHNKSFEFPNPLQIEKPHYNSHYPKTIGKQVQEM